VVKSRTGGAALVVGEIDRQTRNNKSVADDTTPGLARVSPSPDTGQPQATLAGTFIA
jgi:hypothetical protein